MCALKSGFGLLCALHSGSHDWSDVHSDPPGPGFIVHLEPRVQSALFGQMRAPGLGLHRHCHCHKYIYLVRPNSYLKDRDFRPLLQVYLIPIVRKEQSNSRTFGQYYIIYQLVSHSLRELGSFLSKQFTVEITLRSLVLLRHYVYCEPFGFTESSTLQYTTSFGPFQSVGQTGSSQLGIRQNEERKSQLGNYPQIYTYSNGNADVSQVLRRASDQKAHSKPQVLGIQ